jgi:hypothetical protein
MADKTLPDSESARQLAERLRAWAPNDPGPHEPFGLLHSAASSLEAQSARITKLEEALKRLASYEAFAGARAVHPLQDQELTHRIAFAARALTEGK